MNDARISCDASELANREYNTARANLAAILETADRAIYNLAGYLRVAYRGYNPVIRRSLMRNLGFRYTRDAQGQEPAPEEQDPIFGDEPNGEVPQPEAPTQPEPQPLALVA